MMKQLKSKKPPIKKMNEISKENNKKITLVKLLTMISMIQYLNYSKKDNKIL